MLNHDHAVQIFHAFGINESIRSLGPYGSGHVNDTYLVTFSNGHVHDYLLQRINSHVFTNVPALMDNVARVTEHIRQKICTTATLHCEQRCLTLVYAQGKPYYQDQQGDYWRVFHFIRDARTLDIVTNAKQAYEGGKAFGQFEQLVSDLPPPPLHETILHFHNLAARLSSLEQAITTDQHQRVAQVHRELEFVLQHAEQMKTILLLGQAEKIPLRVTHNDTKFNNVLLDKNDEALCVIDLDTVMPGYIHYDYADSIRTVTNTASEDEINLDNIHINLEFFTAFSDGFLSQVRQSLSPVEAATLIEAVPLMPFMLGIRFLTDYLQGDHYFKVHKPEHNLIRTRAQFQLTQEFLKLKPELERIIESMI